MHHATQLRGRGRCDLSSVRRTGCLPAPGGRLRAPSWMLPMVLGLLSAPLLAQSITVDGPTTGATSQLLQFNATADGCQPQPGQWFWFLDGGFAAGVDSNALIEVFWDSPGAKAISALNPGCPQVVGEAVVFINAPGRLGLGSDVYEAGEGGGQLEIAVVRTNGADGPTTVQYETSPLEATAGSDFVSTSGTLQWDPGDASNQVITVPILNDGLFEQTESFLVTLSNPTGASLAGFIEARVDIVDDDPVPGDVVQFAEPVFEVDETDGTATIRLIRSGSSAGDISVDLFTADSTATSPSDYTAVATTVEWPAGDVSEKQVLIPLVDDAAEEGTELVDLELSNPEPEGQVFLGTNDFAQLVLIDDDNPSGSLSWTTAQVSAQETDGTVAITLRRTGGTVGAVTARVTVIGGSATSGTDFQLVQSTVAFADGDGEDKAVEITVIDDDEIEGLESVRLALSIDSGSAVIGSPNVATLRIQDDDAGAPDTVRFVTPTLRVEESVGSGTLQIERMGNLFGSASVFVGAAGGSATLGQDFTFTPTEVFWADSEGGIRSVPVTVIDDGTAEDLETAGFSLSAPQGATLGIPSVATLEIVDDDSGFLDILTPSLQLSEPDDVGVLLIERSGPSSDPASARLALSGTAQRDLDYEIDTTELSWAAGESGVRQVEIRILDDDEPDAGESIVIELVDVEGPSVLRDLAQVAIGDDDVSLPTPQFATLGDLRGPTLVTRHDAKDRGGFTEVWLDDQDRVLLRAGAGEFDATGLVSIATPSATTDRENRLLVLVANPDGGLDVHCLDDRSRPIVSCGFRNLAAPGAPTHLRLDGGPDGTIAAAWIEAGSTALRLLSDDLVPRSDVLDMGSANQIDLTVHDLGAVAVARHADTGTFLEVVGELGERFNESDLGRAVELASAGGPGSQILDVAIDFDASGALIVATAESDSGAAGPAFVRRFDARTKSLLNDATDALVFGANVVRVGVAGNRGGDLLLATAGPGSAQVFTLAEGARRGPAFAFGADVATEAPGLPAVALSDDDRAHLVVLKPEIGSDNSSVESYEFVIPLLPGSCADEPGQNDPLCLTDDRFEITVQWQDFQGNIGSGQPFALTADSGYLWFFQEDNVEVLLKVLDACSFTGGFWVFGTGLTDTEVSMVIDDSVSGLTRTFFNPLRSSFDPIQEINAFETCDGASAGSQNRHLGTTSRSSSFAAPRPTRDIRIRPAAPVSIRANEAAPCVADEGTLCLNLDRFRVEIEWATAQGTDGSGQAVQLTGDTGSFTFFDPDNVEVVIKVLDACDFNGHYWLFAGGLTDVETRMAVTDSSTGTERVYVNPLGSAFEPILDVEAFACQ